MKVKLAKISKNCVFCDCPAEWMIVEVNDGNINTLYLCPECLDEHEISFTKEKKKK